MPCLRKTSYCQGKFASGKSKVFSGGECEASRSGGAGLELLSWSPASRPAPLTPNHNHPAAALGRGKVWFAAPGLGERIKRLSLTFTFALPPNQKHHKISQFWRPFSSQMPPSLLTVGVRGRRWTLLFSCHDLCQHGYLAVILRYMGRSFWKKKMDSPIKQPSNWEPFLPFASLALGATTTTRCNSSEEA